MSKDFRSRDQRSRVAPAGEKRCLLTNGEAAKYLRLKPATLDRMRVQGRGPRYIKVGRILYDIKDLDEWLNANLRRFTQEKPSE